MKLNKRDFARVTKVAKTVKLGDLYNALKHVGDDTTKAEIESVLYELLDKETFCRVVAVFKISTGTK